MRTVRILQFLVFSVLVLTTVAGVSDADGKDSGERRRLLEQQESLVKRIDALKRRQDYLLFLKTMSSADSKYLVLTLSDGSGRLKYKNRVLRQFRFSKPQTHGLQEGALRLTKKYALPGGRKELNFGTDLIVQQEGLENRRVKSLPVILFRKKDFRAVFAALEESGFVYILP